LTLTESVEASAKPAAPKPETVEVSDGPGMAEVAPVDTSLALEEYELLNRRLKVASGSHAELVLAFLGGVGCFAALVGLAKILRAPRSSSSMPRTLLRPFASNSGEDDWREVEPAEEA